MSEVMSRGREGRGGGRVLARQLFIADLLASAGFSGFFRHNECTSRPGVRTFMSHPLTL